MYVAVDRALSEQGAWHAWHGAKAAWGKGRGVARWAGCYALGVRHLGMQGAGHESMTRGATGAGQDFFRGACRAWHTAHRAWRTAWLWTTWDARGQVQAAHDARGVGRTELGSAAHGMPSSSAGRVDPHGARCAQCAARA